MTTDYTTTLYALGAVPASAVRREFRSEEAGAVYLKGQRVDVNGWLSPHLAKAVQLLTDAERERYVPRRQPLSYEEYAALLNIDEYKQTKNSQQYAVMAFALEGMLQDRVTIESVDDIIKVYEGDIGLDDRVLALLKGRLSSDRAMTLYQERQDAHLLRVFPVPRPDEANYIQFLRTIAAGEPNRTWMALNLLYAMDKAGYKDEFLGLTMRTVRETDSWTERSAMYRALVEIGDEKSVQFLVESLLGDPITEARETILRGAVSEKVYSQELVDVVVQLAKGLGGRHEGVTPSRMVNQWQFTLRDYLAWVKDNNLGDPAAQNDVKDALELLSK